MTGNLKESPAKSLYHRSPWDANISDSFATSPMVTVYVGKDKIKYTIHKKLLVDASPIFAKKLADGTKAGQANELKLSDTFPKVFDLFVTWIYRREVPEIVVDRDNDEDGSPQVRPTLGAWIMADDFEMPEWKDKVDEALFRLV